MLVTKQTIGSFLSWLEDQDIVACDTETTGLNLYNGDRMVGISVGRDGRDFYLPFRHGEGENLPIAALPEVINLLQHRNLIFHNAGFDLHVLGNEGLDIETVRFGDTMIAAHLVNDQEGSFGLKQLADKYHIGQGSKDEEELRSEVENRHGKQRAREWKGMMWRLPAEIVEPYASADTQLTWGVWTLFYPFLEHLGYLSELIPEDPGGLYHGKIEYSRIIAKIEQRGLLIDRDLLGVYSNAANTKTEEIVAELRRLTGNPDFKPTAVQCKSAFGWSSFTADYLKELKTPEAELILEHKAYSKADSSYYKPYYDRLAPDGTLHPTFRVTGTKTGRLSCTNPNLQAVPRYNDRQPVKDLFVAREGYTMAEVDLAQAELRVMAYFAPVPEMLSIFEQGRDLHTETAEAFGLPRDVAKRINLSAVYGIGARTFAEKYGVSVEQAKEWLDVYHQGYPGVRGFYYGIQNIARNEHHIKLPTGLIYRYETKEASHYDSRGFNFGEQRASSNFIQGMVGEIMRIGMTRIDQRLQGTGVQMLLTVHDSILIEIPEEYDPASVVEVVVDSITDFGDMPLAADAKIGPRWGKMQKLEV